jgi:hypothetical protein
MKIQGLLFKTTISCVRDGSHLFIPNPPQTPSGDVIDGQGFKPIIQIKKTILPETLPPCTERLCEVDDDSESNNVSNVSDDDDDDDSPIDVHMSEVVTAATMMMMAAPPTWIPYNI